MLFSLTIYKLCYTYVIVVVGQRLVYHRKDIVELLAGRDKSEVVADLKKGNMLRKDQLDHFFYLDEPLQAYTYLFDAVLTAGDVVIEKFHRYLLDSDVSDYFYTLVAPKGMYVLIYYMIVVHDMFLSQTWP